MSKHSVVSSYTIIDQLRHRKTYLTGTEVMQILRWTRQTLCRYVKEGRIPALRIGKDNRFDPGVLAAFLEQRQVCLMRASGLAQSDS
jgi:excisionase family DNA binding protein